MTTLITGGAGFIGSHIQDALIEAGHTVAIVDSLRSGKKENLNPKATFFEVDVRDQQKLDEIFQTVKPEIVFHLAAQNEVPFSMEHPDEDEDINIRGMMNLLQQSVKHGVKKIIYSNTGGAYYGEVEEKDLPITEDHPVVHPTSFYGVTKAAAEQYLKLYNTLHGISYVSLRYANVFGPRQDGNKEAGIVAIFCAKMLKGEQPIINGDGSHTRDYIFVGDVVAANLAAMNHDKNDYFNIATEVRTSNLEVFQTIANILQNGMQPTFGPERPGDAKHNSLSIQKAKGLLGWEPKTSFAEGVKRTLEHYKNVAG